jgi:hydroxyacylglutathione hydrolase
MAAISVVPLRAFDDNYIWTIRDDHKAAVVDPGDADPVLEYLRAERLALTAILCTHHHPDHVGGNEELLQHFSVPVYGPYDDRIPTASRRLREGDKVRLDDFGLAFSVFEIPGHTRSHIAYYGAGMLFCGDTLFACGCGRLFEGTPQQMHVSLAKLAALPDSTAVYCGHEYTLANIRFARAVEPGNGELAKWESDATARRARDEPTVPSTLQREKLANPFLRCDQPEVIASASKRAGRPLGDAASVLGAIREWKNKF